MSFEDFQSEVAQERAKELEKKQVFVPKGTTIDQEGFELGKAKKQVRKIVPTELDLK